MIGSGPKLETLPSEGVVTPHCYGQDSPKNGLECQRIPFYDFLTGTLPPIQITDFLKTFPFFGEIQREGKGMHGYTESYFLSSGTVFCTAQNKTNLGSYFSISGKALGYLNTFEGIESDVLIEALDSQGAKFTRVDIAIDEREKILDLDLIYSKLTRGEISSRLRTWREYTETLPIREIKSKAIKDQKKLGRTIYFGDLKTGNVIFRIYDKSAERGLSIDDHWIRVELQLRREASEQFLQPHKKIKTDGKKQKIRTVKNRDAKKIFLYYLRFLDKTYTKEGILVPTQKNGYFEWDFLRKPQEKKRWKTSDFWTKFLETSEKEKIGLPKYESDLDDLFEYFENSLSGMSHLLEKSNPEKFKNLIEQSGKNLYNKNKRYQKLYENNTNRNQ